MARPKKRRPVTQNEPTLAVVIDPGHGGRDSGATWRSERGKLLMEKDINRDVAMRIPGFLPAYVSYYMTRDRDETISLRNRVLHPFHYDLFVSIHCNAIAERQEEVRGSEVYIQTTKDAWLMEVGYAFVTAVGDALKTGVNDPNPVRSNPHLRVLSLADRIRNKFGRSRSVLRRAPGDPTRGMRDVGTPAFLIELAYMTNAADRKALVTKARRNAAAQAIADVIASIAPQPDPAAGVGAYEAEENDEVPEEE